MKIMSVMPAAAASSTAYWMSGLSTTGSISLGLALVAGRKRLPRPATGKTALVIFFMRPRIVFLVAASPHLRDGRERGDAFRRRLARRAMSSCNPASSMTGTPRLSALASLLPASAPATT